MTFLLSGFWHPNGEDDYRNEGGGAEGKRGGTVSEVIDDHAGSQPAQARAALSGVITASVPELANLTCSTARRRPGSSSARAISDSVGMPTAVPSGSCSADTFVKAGWAWPWMSAVKLLPQ